MILRLVRLKLFCDSTPTGGLLSGPIFRKPSKELPTNQLNDKYIYEFKYMDERRPNIFNHLRRNSEL